MQTPIAHVLSRKPKVRPRFLILDESTYPMLPALQGFNANSSSVAALNALIHELLLSWAQDALDMDQKIATKRSGQRGHTARQDLLAEAALATLQAQDPQTYVTALMAHESILWGVRTLGR